MVIACHYWPDAFQIGSTGVDLFFVLSGYLIGGILLDNRGKAGFFATFYGRRAFRILPLYWLLLVLRRPVPLWWFLWLGQNFHWTMHHTFPATLAELITWSLSIEEQFYLLLPALIVLLPRSWLVRVLWVCVIAAPLWRYALARDHLFTAYCLLPCRLDSLMGGTLIACWQRGYCRSHVLWALLTLAVPATEIALMFADRAYKMNPFSVPALIYAGGVFLAARGRPVQLTILRPLAWLGIGAYSIYLFHVPILDLAGSRALAFPITLAVAWASWRYIEAPLIRFARNRWRYGYVAERASVPIAIP